MQYLRRISTARLLTLCAIVVALGAGGAAIALAGSAGGPTPPPKPLDGAIHDALTAPATTGVSARIRFTNRLVDASSLQGADPILTGATGRMWASPDGGGKLRIELQADGGNGDTQVLVDGDRFTVYDSGSDTVYRGTLPKDSHPGDQKTDQPPTLAKVQRILEKIAGHATLSEATPTNVAGEPAYSVRITPKHDGGLFGAAELAWDAVHGTPLRAAIYAAGSSDPVLELEATHISFESVPASTFAISPPAGARVVDLNPSDHGDNGQEQAPVTGLEAVQKQVPFTIAAPATLAGLPRSEVRLIAMDKAPAALVTYGKGLGGIAVLESQAGQNSAAPKAGEGHGGLSLPKVSINGISGEELDTALGTVLRFERAGVSYVVLGSVPPAAAEAAARAL